MRQRERWMAPSGSGRRGSSYGGSHRSGGRRYRVAIALVVLVVIALGVVQILRPVPKPTYASSVQIPAATTPAPKVPWPSQGSGVLEIPGVGVLSSFGTSQPIPIASVAKMMTAYLILKDHPLALGQNGPSITLTQADYNTYRQQLAAQDSVMAVAPGEVLTEYQALEGLLLPSADNLAITLANWDAGSVTAFVAKMNATARKLGMTHTIYTDPSGLDAKTQSTPADQLKLAQLFEANPVLAQIASFPQATLPVAGVVYNVDYDLGSNGIVGIKTGSTPSGGNFAFDAQISQGPTPYSVIGVVLGQQGPQPLITALDVGKQVAASLGAEPGTQTIIRQGQAVGSLVVPGQARSVPVVADATVSMIDWQGLPTSSAVSLFHLNYPIAKGAVVGHLSITVGEQHKTIALRAGGAVNAPTLSWRLRRL
ncbi:MAG: D-alanyl-D-alanine carboxypeptidase [Acidimicrobiales bacterium]